MVHELANGEKRYRLGCLRQATIEWKGQDSKPAGHGVDPCVALNNHDIAVELHRNPSHETLYCRAARIDGDEVAWPNAESFAKGKNHTRPAVALNDAGVVVEIHEVHEARQIFLDHRVGKVTEASGALSVVWHGQHVRGHTGDMPSIAINNDGVVVKVYRSGSRHDLYCAVGRVKGTTIAFETPVTIPAPTPNGGSAHGHHPSVALTDDGLVVVVHRDSRHVHVLELLGQVSSDTKSITWNRWWYFDEGTRPSVAVAGTMAVEVHQHESSDHLRFSTSLITNRASWMKDRLKTLGPKPLGELVLPASHDAGMYRPNIPALARNQRLTILEQLRYGIRYFELRPMWGALGKGPWLIHHGGVPGPTVQTVLNDVAEFAGQNDGELVILKFSHFKYVDNNHYRRFVRQVEETIGDWLVKEEQIPEGKRLADVTLNEYVDGGAAVLVVVELNLAIDNETDGIWVYREWQEKDAGDLCVHDRYTNTEDFARMRRDQFDKFAAFNGKMNNGKPPTGHLPCDLFLLSWTLTPQVVTTVPVPIFPNLPFADKAVKLDLTPYLLARRSNPHLGHDIHLGGPKPALPPPPIPNDAKKIINLLFVDYVESSRVTDVALFLNDERTPGADDATTATRVA